MSGMRYENLLWIASSFVFGLLIFKYGLLKGILIAAVFLFIVLQIRGWKLWKIHHKTIKMQEELEEALERGDTSTVKKIMGEGIVEIARAGLTNKEYATYQEIVQELTHQNRTPELITRLRGAYQIGWNRLIRFPSMSNALDQVLKEVRIIISEYESGIGRFGTLRKDHSSGDT